MKDDLWGRGVRGSLDGDCVGLEAFLDDGSVRSIKDAVVVKKGYLMLDRAVRAAEVGVVKGE